MFDSSILLSCSTILWFRASVLMWARAEKPPSQRYTVVTKAIFGKPVQTVVDNSRTAHQNLENGISWKISCADESFRSHKIGLKHIGYSQRSRELISWKCSFLLDLREIPLALNFKRLKVVYYRCLLILSKFVSFFNNIWQFLKHSNVPCITLRSQFCNFV